MKKIIQCMMSLSEFTEKYRLKHKKDSPEYLLHNICHIETTVLENAINPYKPYAWARFYQYLKAQFGKTNATMIIYSSKSIAMKHSKQRLIPKKLNIVKPNSKS